MIAFERAVKTALPAIDIDIIQRDYAKGML